MLADNKRRGWASGYRDFADVLLLLRAVGRLGMVEQQNNRVSEGVFSASAGDFSLSLETFIDAMNLEHAWGTWRNKLTTYFRIKSLYLYSKHAGRIDLKNPVHRNTWDVVNHWMEHHDKLLEENWVTKRFGSTELRPIVRGMVQEAYQGKQSLHSDWKKFRRGLLIGGMEYVEGF
jgi:hypothetical protein